MDVVANGVRLQYSESGSGYPVICLHGNGLTRDAWRHFLPELGRGHRAIAYDLRATGKSEAPGRRGVTFTNDDHARDLEAFMDALGIDRAALVGHAFGATVAMRVAIDRPERVAALVLVDIAARIGDKTRASLLGWAETVEREGMGPLVDAAMDRWFVQRMHRDHPETIQFYSIMYAANPPMGYAANCRGIPLFDVRDKLSLIRCPTLVVAGLEDRSVTVAEKTALAAGIPGARLVVVPDASHTVPEEQPEEFTRLTLEFLRQAIPRPA